MAGAISATERELLAQVERALMARGRLQLIERLDAGDAAAPRAILECLQGTEMSAIVEGGAVERLVQVARAESVRLQVENLTLVQTAEGGMLQPAAIEPVITARSRPVVLRPRPFDDLVGREEVLAEIASSLAAGRPVERFGEDGIGKTSLARRLAHAGALPDGVVFFGSEAATAEDLARQLFEALYEATPGFLPSETRLRRLLAGVRALLVIDDLALGRDDLGRLLDLAPECGFMLFSAERRLIGEGDSAELAGLPEDAALILIERHLGRPLLAEERGQATAFAAGARGNPLKLIEAAAAVGGGRSGWAELAGVTPRGLVGRLLSGLSSEDRRLLDIVHAAGSGPLDVATLAAVSGEPGAGERAAGLAERGLLVANSPTYRLPTHLGGELEDAGPLRDAVQRALARSLRAGGQPPAAGVLAALEAGESGSFAELVLAADVELLRRRQLGAWARALDQGLAAASARGDRALQARMLHQLGTRALLLEHRDDARSLLGRALELREALGDEPAAALTRHNLEFLSGGPPDAGEWPPPNGRPRWPWIAGLGALAVVGALVGVLAVSGGSDESGSGRTGLITVSPERHDFGAVVGSESATVTVAWVPEAPELGLGIRFVGGSSPAFQRGGCEVRLGPQRPSCELEVTFTPAPGEAAQARLAIRPQVQGAEAVRVELAGSGARDAVTEVAVELELAVSPAVVAPGEKAQAEIGASAPVEVALSTTPEGRVTPSATSVEVQPGQAATVALIAGRVEGPVEIVVEAAGTEVSEILRVDAPPALSLPVVVEEQTPLESTTVDFDDQVSAFDTVDGSLEPECTPASGSTFAADTETSVACEVTDSAGNTETGSFTIAVESTPVD